MNGVIEIILGLGFVFILFSSISSSLLEWIAGWAGRRRNTLALSLRGVIGEELARRFMEHPAVQGVQTSTLKPLEPPSYVTPNLFALVYLDITSEKWRPVDTPWMRTEAVLRTLTRQSPAEVVFRLEKWFSEEMERVSGVYKRRTQAYTLLMAALLTIAFNVDSVRIADALRRDAALRSALADRAVAAAANRDSLNTALGDQLAGIPLGWSDFNIFDDLGAVSVGGWLISMLAISLGAPFWFDLVNRIANLRQTGKRPPEMVA